MSVAVLACSSVGGQHTSATCGCDVALHLWLCMASLTRMNRRELHDQGCHDRTMRIPLTDRAVTAAGKACRRFGSACYGSVAG
jgi:hypothetical protein